MEGKSGFCKFVFTTQYSDHQNAISNTTKKLISFLFLKHILEFTISATILKTKPSH